MKTFLLIFDDGNGSGLSLRDLVKALDDGAQMYAMDGHVCFIKSNLDVWTITQRFLELAGSSLFVVTEISSAECAGRMGGTFWDFMQNKPSASAA